MNFPTPKRPGQFIVVVTGGRTFCDELRLFEALDHVHAHCIGNHLGMVVVEGGAQGADRMARTWANNNPGVLLRIERAHWEDLSFPDAIVKEHENGRRYDARAGTRRNQRMIDQHNPDLCVAMPGGNGTADMRRRCELAGIPIFEGVAT